MWCQKYVRSRTININNRRYSGPRILNRYVFNRFKSNILTFCLFRHHTRTRFYGKLYRIASADLGRRTLIINRQPNKMIIQKETKGMNLSAACATHSAQTQSLNLASSLCCDYSQMAFVFDDRKNHRKLRKLFYTYCAFILMLLHKK